LHNTIHGNKQHAKTLSLRFILLVSSRKQQSHPNGLRHSDFPTKYLHVFVITFLFVSCSIYLSLLDLDVLGNGDVPIIKL